MQSGFPESAATIERLGGVELAPLDTVVAQLENSVTSLSVTLPNDPNRGLEVDYYKPSRWIEIGRCLLSGGDPDFAVIALGHLAASSEKYDLQHEIRL